ncbi:hypothetical protein DFH09DRAFT_1190080 [Mycena vulgaris]|nr:hypothetical protein DFH09DRAFT_1190080 [Mycena vulgaris]
MSSRLLVLWRRVRLCRRRAHVLIRRNSVPLVHPVLIVMALLVCRPARSFLLPVRRGRFGSCARHLSDQLLPRCCLVPLPAVGGMYVPVDPLRLLCVPRTPSARARSTAAVQVAREDDEADADDPTDGDAHDASRRQVEVHGDGRTSRSTGPKTAYLRRGETEEHQCEGSKNWAERHGWGSELWDQGPQLAGRENFIRLSWALE